MSDPVKPPLFDEAPARVCSRWLGDRNCGEPAVMHVIWDDAMENGCVCAEHVPELGSRWSFLAVHHLGPDCGMPGSEFFIEENVCRCPGSLHEEHEHDACGCDDCLARLTAAQTVGMEMER